MVVNLSGVVKNLKFTKVPLLGMSTILQQITVLLVVNYMVYV